MLVFGIDEVSELIDDRTRSEARLWMRVNRNGVQHTLGHGIA